MSGRWWEKAQTTQGHGIHSQYKPDHMKEWIAKETRRQERGSSPEKAVYDPANSLHRSSLHFPIEGERIEHKHHATTKSLTELKNYQTAAQTSIDVKYATAPEVVGAQPLQGKKYLPHLAHHHHFGWNPPTPQSRIGAPDIKNNIYKMGDAQKFNHNIYAKSALITTRKA